MPNRYEKQPFVDNLWQKTEFGRVPKEWSYEPLENFTALITYGFTNPMPTANEGYFMLTAKDIFGGKIQYSTARKTTKEAYSQLLTEKSRPKIDDVLITKDGSIGRVAIVDQKDICISQSVALIRPYKIVPLFLKKLLEADQYQKIIDNEATGSTIQHIYITKINRMLIAVPPLPEQKAIASVLSSLDDKIDLLHRQNKTLEAMADALFRQWFIEEAQEDWEEGCLGDIVDINPTYQLKKGANSCYLEMSNLSTSTFNPSGWIQREFTSGMKFKNGDTLLARITPCLENGKTCYVTFLKEDEVGWGSTEYIVLRMKKPYHPYISYIFAKNQDFREYAISSMSGSSGRQRAQSEMLKEYIFKIPPQSIIYKLNTQLSAITEKLEKNALQIPTLEKLRDNLLPKLMSGEVRVNYE